MTSHDLKTPLRGMSHLHEFLDEDLTEYKLSKSANPDVEINLKRMKKQIMRMEELIEAIMIYTKIKHQEIRISHVDLGQDISEICKDLQIENKIKLIDLPTFNTNARQLEQVFTNLINNAYKYHHDRDKIELEIKAEKNDLFYIFSVKDNGPGIEEKYYEKIFEMFTRLHVYDKVEGSGIGLSMVKKIIESNGGTIKVESEIGKGSKFIFTWPVTINK